MFRWLRNLKRQHELSGLRLRKQVPNKPILCFLREAIIFLRQIPEPMPLLEPHRKVCSYTGLRMMLWFITAWLGGDRMAKHPEQVLSEGIQCTLGKSEREPDEWVKCLEYFIQNQETFGEYFYFVDGYLFFQDTISLDEQISISRYVRENYHVPRPIK